MQANLQAVCPGLLAITRNAEKLWFLNFITYSDDLHKLSRIRRKTVLSIKGIGLKYAEVKGDWQKAASFSHDAEWVGPMIVEDARRILDLRQKIKTLEVRCEELMGKSEIAQLVDTIPGFATVCSSELAGEIGTIERSAK